MEQVNINSGVLNDGRRYLFVIEGITKTLSGDQYVVSGDIHGTVRVGDEVNILGLNDAIKAKIVKIETQTEGKFESPEEATDVFASLAIEVEDDHLIKKLAVLTSINPVEGFDPQKPMENPFLAGLLWTADKYKENKTYIGLLSATLAHTTFVTPMKPEPILDEPGKVKMGFYMLPAKKPEEGKMPEEFFFPIFTDFEEMAKWTALTKGGAKVPATPIKFQQVLDLVKPEAVKGFIVNPFSKNMMIATEPFINAIINSEGYKKDFGPKEENGEDAE